MPKNKKTNLDNELKKELRKLMSDKVGVSYADQLLAKSLSGEEFTPRELETWNKARRCYNLLENGYSETITAKMVMNEYNFAYVTQSYIYINLAYQIYCKPNQTADKHTKKKFVANLFYNMVTMALKDGKIELAADLLERGAKIEGLYEKEELEIIPDMPKIYKRTENPKALLVQSEVEDVEVDIAKNEI